jgi:hypothetical protein
MDPPLLLLLGGTSKVVFMGLGTRRAANAVGIDLLSVSVHAVLTRVRSMMVGSRAVRL